MIEFLAAVALVVGTVLFTQASTRIIRHDDGSVGVAVRGTVGFALLVVVGMIGVFSL